MAVPDSAPLSVPVSVLDLSGVRAGGTTADALADSLALAQAADRLGAARYWVAEHHNVPSVAATSPPVLVAAIAARTQRIRVGSGGVMLPNHSPYVVAEQFALLEALYPGRIDLGIGRAPGTDPVTAWALRRSSEGLGPEDFDEHVGLVRSWLSPRGVTAGRGIRLLATPAASGYPELWLLGSSDYSARLAARLGLRYCYAAHFGGLDPAAVLGLYADGFRPSPELDRPHAMVCTSALVGATQEEADYLAGPSTLGWINLRRNAPEPLASPSDAAARLTAAGAEGVSGTRVVGTAAGVRAALGGLVADAGAQELMVVTTAYDVATRVDTLAALLT